MVALEKNKPAVYLLNEVMTAGERGKLKDYLTTLTGLPDIKSAARDIRDAAAPQRGATPEPSRSSGEETYFGPGDLARRWKYSKQGVQRLARHPAFPPPRFTVQRGKIRIWAAADIQNYERDRPELHSEAAKIFKVKGFARALRKGRQQPSA